jgi:hypothetical protein
MLQNLKYPRNIASGTGEIVYIALQSWFDTIAKPEGAGMAITESHVFHSDKGFLQLQCAPEKNSAAGKSSGEIGLTNKQFLIQGFVAGSYIEQHSLMRSLLNKSLIVIAPDANDPSIFYQVGSEDFPAYIKPDFASGSTKDGVKGYAIEATSTNTAFAIYSGNINLSSDEVSLLLALMVDDIDYLIDELNDTIDTE